MANETPETPIVYKEAGPVYAYRGQEIHGVPMPGTPDLVDQFEGATPVLVEEIPDPPEPIPVRIVRTGGRELSRWRVQRAYAGDDVTQVVGRDESRNTTRIRNLSSTALDRVWIAGASHMANSVFGYPLDPGAEISLNTEDPIFIKRDSASPTNPVPVAVLVEYSIMEN